MEHSRTSHIHYQSYLLRIWRDDLGDVRRVTLQSTTTEKFYHFATLDLLLAFLSRLPDDSADDEEGPTV